MIRGAVLLLAVLLAAPASATCMIPGRDSTDLHCLGPYRPAMHRAGLIRFLIRQDREARRFYCRHYGNAAWCRG